MCTYVNVEFSSVFDHPLRTSVVWAKTTGIYREGRPDTVVEVWARSEYSGARGERSNHFSEEVDKTTSWGFRRRPYLFLCTYVVTYVRTFLFFLARSTAQRTDNSSGMNSYVS